VTTQEQEAAPPRLFVSYSWSGPEHEERVLSLATELRRSGVDVILDKWDLKEGHDAYAFMEQMVTDHTVNKVILICDKRYAERTNERAGGVGAEAQIISGELYAKQAQDKFAAVVLEHDEEGQPYLPAYYKGRIYIDLSDPDTYAQYFDQLLRWLFDRPLYEKPDIGTVPGFLTQDSMDLMLATTSQFRRALEALRQGRHTAIPATSEYFMNLAQQFEKMRLDPESVPFDEVVVRSIDDFLPYRNEAIDIFLCLASYANVDTVPRVLHKFFEQLLPYLDRPEHVTTWKDAHFDNYRFIVHELYLYAIAALIQHDCIECASHLMGTEYYASDKATYGRSMVGFDVFNTYMNSLDSRDQRLGSDRTSVRAYLLRDRCKDIGLDFRAVTQADFILYIRSHAKGLYWWPWTLLPSPSSSRPFEIFSRSKSAAYFARTKVLLGVDSKNALGLLMQELQAANHLPRWRGYPLNVAALLDFEQIDTGP